MDCAKIETLLYGYVCQALRPKLHKQVARHLESCTACHEKYREVEKRLGRIRESESLPATSLSAHKILKKARRRAIWLRYAAFFVIMGVFLAIIAVGLLIARYKHERVLIGQLERAVFIYRLRQGEYPDEKNLYAALKSIPDTQPYLVRLHNRADKEGRFLDYWGSPLIYRKRGVGNPGLVDIYSFGFNGKDDHGEWDDIKNWHSPPNSHK